MPLPMQRPTRLVTLIRTLRAGGHCDAGTLATRLGVSRRSVYRDAAILMAAGLPIVGTTGTGYRYDDDCSVVTVDLDFTEALALLDALAASPTALPTASHPRHPLAIRIEARLPPLVRAALGPPPEPDLGPDSGPG